MDFDNWIKLKLKELHTDESVFGPYITGVLEGEEPADEQTEALEELLTGIIDDGALKGLIDEIFMRWRAANQAEAQNSKNLHEVENVDEKLAKLMESNIKTNAAQRIYTADEMEIRSKILAEYSQLSDHENDEDEDAPVGGIPEPSDLIRNTNVHDVQQLNKEKREQARMDSQMKKEKDKEDREKQKKSREEKKEKRKTVKQERRR